jgi:hypothetical protein
VNGEAPGFRPLHLLLVFALVLLGFVAVGRLAMEAWLNRPAPTELPEIGATTDTARPFLLVIIDGLREASAWTRDDPPMPWLQSFSARGAWGTALAGEPTLTAPCVRTLLTGRRPDLLTGFRNFNARPVRGSVIEYLHARGARTAHGGDAAAFQFCRDCYDNDDDVLQFPDKGPTDQGESDKEAVPHVLRKIESGSDCITLHVTGPDHAGHKHGALGREYWKACRTVDGQISSVVEAFLARHPAGTVLIASDHGVSAMGTHGGGEASAKHAPFVLVGPGVQHGRVEIVDQSSLAPTVCALLGLPQPPLADAPPALELMDLPEDVETAALRAYVEARLFVARDLHGDAVDAIEKHRAEVSQDELAVLVNRFLLPNSAGHATAALFLAALWLIVLVAWLSVGPPPRPASWVAFVASGVGLVLVFDQFPGLVPISPFVAGALLLGACLLTSRAIGIRPLPGAAFTLACLLAVPVITGGGITLQELFTRAHDPAAVGVRMRYLIAALALVLLVFFRPRRLLADLRARVRKAPGLVLAFGGVLLGFTLTLRPFIDPYIHVMILYAAVGVGVVAWMVFCAEARARPLWERAALAGVGLVLFVITRIAEGAAGQVWVNATEMRDPLMLAQGLWLTGSLLLLVPRATYDARNAPGLALAAVSLVLAYGMRADPDVNIVVSLGAVVSGLAALAWTVARGTPDGRLVVRLLAACALARRLSPADAEFLVFALSAVGAALAARLRVPRTRVGLAWLAVGLLALRTAIFHAMGFEESFSTLDVGQAFAGLGSTKTQALDAAGGAVMTWQVFVAIVQMGIRMSLPWLLLAAPLARAVQRTPGAGPGTLRVVAADLMVALGARGAAIATALWAWWRNSWWMTHAYTVYAYGAGDVILLLLCFTLCGVWRRDAEASAVPPEPEPEGGEPVPQPSPA